MTDFLVHWLKEENKKMDTRLKIMLLNIIILCLIIITSIYTTLYFVFYGENIMGYITILMNFKSMLIIMITNDKIEKDNEHTFNKFGWM
jgi:hypothetical protein